MHFPQSIQTMGELKDLASIPFMIISPKSGKPIIEVVQDILVGSYRITNDRVNLPEKVVANLQMVNSYFDTSLNNKESFTGKEIFSKILPPSFFINNKKLEIVDSIIKSGQLDKKSFQSITNGLIPVIYHDYGPYEAKRFLDNTQRLICRWLMLDGFSVGISDLVMQSQTNQEIKQKIKELKQKAYEDLGEFRKGNINNDSISNNENFVEAKIINTLNDINKQVSKICLDNIRDESNRMINMIRSGSKGKENNVAQMIGCVGQQNFDGKRISYGFTERTLPHFTKYDDGPDARGFVENSFIHGLTPQEVFFHAMGGREGLIDTAVKSVTWDTPIIIIENNESKYVKIGEWIDGYLDNKENKDLIEVFPNDMNMEMMKIEDVYIPTTDNDGNMRWELMTNVSRHDPGNILYEIKTHSGRKVKVTASKSLLIWKNGKFIETKTSEIRIGDCVPVSMNLEEPPIIKEYINDLCLNESNGIYVGIYMASGISNNLSEKTKKIIIEDGSFLYNSSKSFIKGFINGYYSEKAIITNNSIMINSDYQKEIEDIAYLLTRIGIFSKISKNSLIIKQNWVKKFREKITLINNEKNEQIKNIPYIENNDIINDVVKDDIIQINEIIVNESYKKVYDVTVPSTQNFTIYNGIGCKNTSDTGYIQRRLVKSMEDVKIYNDFTVRNATGTVVQFIYGEDGMDGTKIEQQKIDYIEYNEIEMASEYLLQENDDISTYLLKKTYDKFKKDAKEIYEKSNEIFKKILEDKEFLIKKVWNYEKNDVILYPIPFDRIINNAISRVGSVSIRKRKTDLDILNVFNSIDDLIENYNVKGVEQSTRFFHILLRCYLNPKKILKKYNFNISIFNYIIDDIKKYFKQSIAHPGDMIGIVAAQTIGEMGTQMTLDSFHVSGTDAAVKATSGVPRLKEILSVSKNIKTPMMNIHLKNDIGIIEEGNENESFKNVFKVKNSIEIVRLSDILESSSIYWDDGTNIGNDEEFLNIYNTFLSINTDDTSNESKLVLRMVFNKNKMILYGLKMIDIYTSLNMIYKNYINTVYSDDNADQCIMRFRMNYNTITKAISDSDEIASLKALEHNLVYNILLKGVKGIKKISLNKISRNIYDDNTSSFKKQVKWILNTNGSNMKEILANPNVDPYKTRSNDIREIYETLGIEAARKALALELEDVIGEGVMNYRHLSLLIDTMTSKGQLMSIDRHGINRSDIGPLAKSSFEETTDMLVNASIFSDYDNINGVSGNVMLGQKVPCGTGDVEVLLDEEVFMNKMLELHGEDHEIIYEQEEEEESEDEDISFKIKEIEKIDKNVCFNRNVL